MTWMNKRAGGFPLYLATARGARVTDLDGHSYIDLCLGDTGAMAGHSPGPVVEAVRQRMLDEGGLTAMMPTEDAAWVGAELARRFGLPYWSFSLTATDANRWAMRLARALTGRSKVLFNSYCYHGSVDESLIVLDDAGRPASRAGNVGAPSDVLLDEPRRRVQRPRGARSGARARRCGGRADGTGADEHRHRAARTGLSGRGTGGDERPRHASDPG